MCGIAGFVDFGNRPIEVLTDALVRMQSGLAHRGSDDGGRVVLYERTVSQTGQEGNRLSIRRQAGPSVGFAHQRLAIIDLSPRGHQPMAASNGVSWLTYNGEIYNFRTLRQRLIDRGVCLRSESDTEVVAEMLASDGESALTQLRGMFAFAFWDDAGRRLLLARDRFGMKPLVYAQPERDLLLFASEPRALLASGYVDDERAEEQAGEFLVRGSVDAGSTFWKHIRAVVPGEWLEFGGATVRRHIYWALEDAFAAPTPCRPARAVAAKVRGAIVESVEAHLVSDVPIAIFLSGGLDSTAVLAAAREATSGPLRTFTIAMPGAALDESAYAREAARQFGSDHTEVSIDSVDVDSAVEELFGAMQNPSVDGLNTLLVAKAARRAGVKVALSGIGGDELFGGYASFPHVMRVARARRRYGGIARGVSPLLRRWAPEASARLERVFGGSRNVADLWWRSRQIIADADVPHLTGRPAPAVSPMPKDASTFDEVRYHEFKHFLIRQLLQEADTFTMCQSLELRTPFVDHHLVRASVQAGRWRRAPGLSFKATLFQHLDGLRMPDAIARRKQGFVLPYDAWIRSALSTSADGCLSDLRSRLDQDRYRPLVDRYLAGQLHWSAIWALYVLERVSTRAFRFAEPRVASV